MCLDAYAATPVNFHHSAKYRVFCTISCQASFNSSKRSSTYKSKTGYDHPHHNPLVKTQMKQNSLEKYGTEHPSQSQHSKDKTKETKLERYGVRNFAQTGLAPTGYQWYEYVLPSGKIIKCQGYENRYIPILIRKYGEDNIEFEKSKIPKIKYTMESKTHMYFPDFYIPEDNLVIEIKSEYTLNVDLERNNLKFQAVKEAGYAFKLKTYK